MHAVMPAKPGCKSKLERGCRGEGPFLEGVKGSYCKYKGKGVPRLQPSQDADHVSVAGGSC